MDVTPATDKGNILFRCFQGCCFGQSSRAPSVTESNKAVWRKFGYNASNHFLPPIFAFLIDLYDGKDIIEGLESCRINPDYTSARHLRNDLQYYIPQLTNFVVFHENFLCKKLTNFLEDASKADPYFAHCYYWYINSLVSTIGQQKVQAILDNIVQKCSGEPQTQLFTFYYEKFIWALKKKLTRVDYEKKIKDIETRKQEIQTIIASYKSNSLDPKNLHMRIRGLDLDLKPYVSPYLQETEASTPFTSTIIFLEDLYVIAEELLKKQVTDKLSLLKSHLQNINKSLPSCIYIPFVKDSLRHYAVLNIAVEETRVFSTKERAPFYVCLETFRPQEELSYEYNELFRTEEADSSPRTKLMNWAKRALQLKPKRKTKHYITGLAEPEEHFKSKNIIELVSSPLTLQGISKAQEEAKNIDESYTRQAAKSMVISREKFLDFVSSEEFIPATKNQKRLSIPNRLSIARKTVPEANDAGISVAYQEEPSSVPSSYADFSHHSQLRAEPRSFAESVDDNASSRQEMRLSTTLNEPLVEEGNKSANNISTSRDGLKSDSMLSEEEVWDFFGEDSKDQATKIREKSPFKHLKTWKLIHMIVKTGADMKEEQFAIQLISQFDQIFKDEKVNLILTPYEILSLGNDFGVMEVVKDAITMSRLKEKMYRQKIPSLNSFFDRYYGKEADIARKRFCRSLAAYSLVCYFLQVKDRHNGNILFHKLGHILHIDFGFLLTNSPGKGVEFEKKVPFKLLTEYVEVLGGPRSSLFQEFRKLFYRGFMAARKHREQILILVKMMYSTQGANLPCFKGGSRAITELEQRFCPPGVHEKDLMGYCYNLINQSLDNWRAKCYDKYQYHFQGIFY